MAAAAAAKTEVHSRTQDDPAVTAAHMFLFHDKNVLQSDVHFCFLRMFFRFRGIMREKE